jgi:hypothetical protein
MFDTAVRHLGADPTSTRNGLWKAGREGYRPLRDGGEANLRARCGLSRVTAIPAKPHSFDYAKLADPNPDLGKTRKFFLDILRGPGRRTPSIATYPSSA